MLEHSDPNALASDRELDASQADSLSTGMPSVDSVYIDSVTDIAKAAELLREDPYASYHEGLDLEEFLSKSYGAERFEDMRSELDSALADTGVDVLEALSDPGIVQHFDDFLDHLSRRGVIHGAEPDLSFAELRSDFSLELGTVTCYRAVVLPEQDFERYFLDSKSGLAPANRDFDEHRASGYASLIVEQSNPVSEANRMVQSVSAYPDVALGISNPVNGPGDSGDKSIYLMKLEISKLEYITAGKAVGWDEFSDQLSTAIPGFDLSYGPGKALRIYDPEHEQAHYRQVKDLEDSYEGYIFGQIEAKNVVAVQRFNPEDAPRTSPADGDYMNPEAKPWRPDAEAEQSGRALPSNLMPSYMRELLAKGEIIEI